MNTTEHPKLRLTLRSQILGLSNADPQYFITLKAFDYAELHHQGFRKDNVTPEFSHQLNILGVMLTQLQNMKKPAVVLAVILLHDTLEDNGELESEIRSEFPEIYVYLERISKVRRGVKVSNDEYYPPMAVCEICSLAKPADRLHNLSTMMGVMTPEKIRETVEETRNYVLPLIKTAMRTHHAQTSLYQLLKLMINMELANLEKHLAIIEK